jgi:hypothetical protein
MTDQQDQRPTCPLPHRDDRPRYSWEAAGTILCGGHVRGLDHQLAELPKLYELLAKAHLSSGAAIGYGSRSAEKPLVIKSKVTEHRGRIIGALAFLTATVADQRGLSDPARYEVADMARFLRRHLDWILRQNTEDLAADDVAGQISDLHYDARQLIWPDHIDRRTRIPCPQDDCPGMLQTSADRDEPDDDKLPSALTCDTCGMPVPPRAWRALARDVHNLSGHVTEEAAILWAIAEGHLLGSSTLRVWVMRGEISRYGIRGHYLYDAEELAARLEKRVWLIKRGDRPPDTKHAPAA